MRGSQSSWLPRVVGWGRETGGRQERYTSYIDAVIGDEFRWSEADSRMTSRERLQFSGFFGMQVEGDRSSNSEVARVLVLYETLGSLRQLAVDLRL